MKSGNWELNFHGILNIGYTIAKWENKPSVEQILEIVKEMPVVDAETLVKDLYVVPENFGPNVRLLLEEVFDEDV